MKRIVKPPVLNVFLASFFFQSKIGDEILDAVRVGCLNLLISKEFQEELDRKVEHFSSKLSPEEILKIHDSLGPLNEVAELVKVKSNLKVCRDAHDDYLVNLAIDGRANFLVTRDKDLLEIEDTKIRDLYQTTLTCTIYDKIYPFR